MTNSSVSSTFTTLCVKFFFFEFSVFWAFKGLHSERLSYWTRQYEHEKGILLGQYEAEMESYKDRKFRAHKELECVFYAIEQKNEAQLARDEMEQLNRIDDVRSKARKSFHNNLETRF